MLITFVRMEQSMDTTIRWAHADDLPELVLLCNEHAAYERSTFDPADKEEALGRMFVNDTAPYDHERAAHLSSEICDFVVDRLSHGRLPRKYIAQCTIVQKIGAGLHTAASATWDVEADGCYAVKAESRGQMLCILTVFGVAL